MQGTNVLFGQIAVVFGIVIAGVWGATQWTAAALGYQVRLGSPWFDCLGTSIYHPWKLFEWWFFFGAYAPEVFDTGGAIAGTSGMVAVVVAIAMSVWRSRQARLVTTYGSARWANAQDIRKAGLTQPAGVFLGQHDHQYLRHEGPEHVLTFAPTRSGKGVGLVVPTLLSWPASAVIHDIKGENWQITAGWRSRFSHCLLFNPTDSKSAAYNPLLEVRRGAHEVRDVQNIADILVDPEGALEKRNHWEKTSHALLVGAILHVLYAGEDKTLRGVANFLSSLPGNAYANVRQPIVSTLNLAHMMPVSAVWAGPEKNDHLDGPPLIVTRTDGATPFRLVTHIGDVGHTLVAGPTGMGKSVLLATLAMQFRRYPGSRIFAFDMGRSMRATILGLGGEYYDLGTDGEIAFQPLARIDREGYRTWAAEWIEGRLLHEGVAVGPDEKAAIWSALGSLAGAPVEQRTMTGLSVLLQSNTLRQALSPYVLGGAHGKLLDADHDRLGGAVAAGARMAPAAAKLAGSGARAATSAASSAKSAFQAGSAAAGGGAKGAMAGLGNVAKAGAQSTGRAAASRASAAGQRMAAPFRAGWNGAAADGGAGAASGKGAAGEAASGAATAQTQEQPAWAKRLHRRQQLTHAATTTAHVLRGGDGGGSGQGPSLRDSDS